MKKTLASAVSLVLLFLAGCTTVVMPSGRYQLQDNSGAGDYAITYGDLIFLNIRAPKRVSGPDSYWTWAGNYSIAENGEFQFDMDKQTAKKWSFNYSFVSDNGNIRVNDWSENRAFILRYERPQRGFQSMQ